MVTAGWCRYCCKSPKSLGANISAVKKLHRRPLIRVSSIALRGSSVNLSSGDEVPHIFTRKSRVQPKEILMTSAKGLLQQNLPGPDVSRCSKARGLISRWDPGGRTHPDQHSRSIYLGFASTRRIVATRLLNSI